MKTFKIPFTKGAKGLFIPPSEGVQLITQTLEAKVFRGKSREVEDRGIISRKLITTEGVNNIRDILAGESIYTTLVSGLGTAVSGAEAVTDTFAGKFTGGSPITGLNAGANDLVADDTYPTSFVFPVLSTVNKQLIVVSNFDFVGHANADIRENFLCMGYREYGFTTTILLDRSVFSAIPVTSSDKIKFTYTLNFTSGG